MNQSGFEEAHAEMQSALNTDPIERQRLLSFVAWNLGVASRVCAFELGTSSDRELVDIPQFNAGRFVARQPYASATGTLSIHHGVNDAAWIAHFPQLEKRLTLQSSPVQTGGTVLVGCEPFQRTGILHRRRTNAKSDYFGDFKTVTIVRFQQNPSHRNAQALRLLASRLACLGSFHLPVGAPERRRGAAPSVWAG